MSPVRTVLGDVAADSLGVTYLHEHLIIDHSLVADRFPHISLPSVDEAAGEARRCRQAGVAAMVDVMPCAAGRNVLKLAEVSRLTGLSIVVATGLHTARYYTGSPWVGQLEPQRLAELFIADVTEGVDRFDYSGPVPQRTEHRAGIVKLATLGEEPTPAEGRLLEAAAVTQHRTGCPIITHCEEGMGAAAQVARLVALDVDPSRIVLSHTDKVRDMGYHRELLDTGVNVEYDQLLRQHGEGEYWTLRLIEAMAAGGYVDQLMVGTDGARRSLWTELGGAPGLAYLKSIIDERLDPEIGRALLVANPARFLEFRVS